jgi:hypothetical protein
MPGKRFWVRTVAAAALVVAGVTAFFVFYHPPMRLMPVPLILQGTSAQIADVGPALQDGAEIEVFYGTSRLPVGPRDARVYSVAPDRRLHLGRALMRIGDEGSTLDQIFEWSTGADRDDRPFINLERMTEYASLPSEIDPKAVPDPESQKWYDEINEQLAKSRHKNILVYVHGANTTVERAAGQASQLRHFTGRDAVVVLFAWPTAENFLRYSRDIQTAYGAAPRLTELIQLLAAHSDAEKIDLFTYSAGATVGSDALALLSASAPDVAKAHLGEVLHAAPDADFSGFVDDLAVYSADAARVTTAVNLGDSALRLAAVMNRASRAGRPDLAELSPEASEFLLKASSGLGLEVLQVRPENMDAMSASSHTFWYDDPWVSSDVLVTLLFNLSPAERGLEQGVANNGAVYWTFPPDYPERIIALRSQLIERVRRDTNP